jgi:hypothetical protein
MGFHIMSPPPKPSDSRPILNDAFDAVIARGMAKKPEARFTSAGELGRAAWAAAGITPMPTTPDPISESPASTRQFVATASTVATAGIDHPQPPTARRRTGAQWTIVGAIAVMFALAGGAVMWLLLGENRTHDIDATPASAPIRGEPSTGPPTSSPRPPIALPGTDSQGFIDYPAARCDAGTTPAVLARTTESVFVVCRSGPGDFYYRGVRLSDSATIELANAVRSSGGFDITNPTDGTRYQIRPGGLTFITPDGKELTEQMVEYSSI